jgi:hypothetical protein
MFFIVATCAVAQTFYSDYPLPRFGQGAFRMAVEQIYKVGFFQSITFLLISLTYSQRPRPAWICSTSSMASLMR